MTDIFFISRTQVLNIVIEMSASSHSDIPLARTPAGLLDVMVAGS
jgi:hypothetical protein